MSKVTLIPLAITDLSLRYARFLGDNKIIHYRVGAVPSLLGMPGHDPFEMVKQHIQEFEPEAEVELAGSVVKSQNMVDMSEAVLTPRLKTELSRKHIKSQLHTYSAVPSAAEGATSFKERMAYLASRLGLSRFVPDRYFKRRITACSYLSYTYQEQDENLAVEALRGDLQTLSDRGLIMGHLAMPTSMYLADTVGSGVATKALFCFVFADQNKLCRQLGKSPLEMSRSPLKDELGIRSEAFEGGLGFHLSSTGPYKIEEVDVMCGISDASRKAYVQNYLQNREYINEVASHQRQELKECVIEKESFVDGLNKLCVNVNILK